MLLRNNEIAQCTKNTDTSWRENLKGLKHQIFVMTLMLFFLFPMTCLAEEVAPEEAKNKITEPEERDTTLGGISSKQKPIVWMPMPPSNFYPHYTADPMRAQSAITFLYMDHSEIPQTGDGRFSLRLGGRWGLVRLHPEGEPDRGLQVDFEGGFFGHFDMDYRMDNIGWDGMFGLQISYKPKPHFGFRIGTLHDSPHVGDEYGERTGRKRIDYTRNEVIGGTSWSFAPRCVVYAEGGFSFNHEDFQDPWRLQAGIEYIGERRFLKGYMPWYAALDLRAYQENHWNIRTTVQLGLILSIGRRTNRYRFAFEFCDGRSVMSEFYFRKERYLGFGWYFDF